MKITLLVPSADINAVLDAVGKNQGLDLEGEVQDLAGVLNPDAAYHVRVLENGQGILGELLKAWVRWNAQSAVYDYYLEADRGEVFEHTVPYVGRLY